MSRRTYDVFVKLSQFAYPSCASPTITVPSVGPSPTQPSLISSPSGSSVPRASQSRTSSLACSPPRSLTPPASQQVALPHVILPPPSQPLQLPRSPIDHGMVSLHLIASSPNTSPPLNLLPQSTSGLTPYSSLLPASRLSASCTPTSQFSEHTRFSGAHDFVINDPSFITISHASSGLEELLKNSMPDAFHNSAARDPPPKCHLGTRKEYITRITSWALGDSNHNEPILWMHGPFGVGKTAVAQSCAEALHLQNRLAATLFFSRSNTDRDDPRRVFTSIAYQIASVCPSFRDIVDARIQDDPALITKSLSTQYEELIAQPLSQIDIISSGIAGRVAIIDGLDECRGTPEQCEIIRVIATSARDRKTPFRWFITSRPEDPIIRTMKSPAVSFLSFHLELPVSRKIDHEILLYLTDELNKIRESYSLPKSWPSEEELAIIVDRTAGLWIYVTTIVRFIIDENSLGPRDQLRIVVEFAKDMPAKVGPDNPLAEMDHFYTLIMERIPLKVRTLVRKILLLDSAVHMIPYNIAGVLCLSEEQFRHLCTFIQSVVGLENFPISTFDLEQFHFYHTSFLDFIRDPERSKELCIYGNFLNQNRREYLDWLHRVCSHSTGRSDIILPSEPVLHEGWDHAHHYQWNLYCFWRLCSVPDYPIDIRTAKSFGKLQFQMMLRLTDSVGGASIRYSKLRHLRDNLSTELRDKIIRFDKCPTPGCTNTDKVWILGHGDNETVATYYESGKLVLENHQDPRPGWCPCGYQIKRGWFSGIRGIR